MIAIVLSPSKGVSKLIFVALKIIVIKTNPKGLIFNKYNNDVSKYFHSIFILNLYK